MSLETTDVGTAEDQSGVDESDQRKKKWQYAPMFIVFFTKKNIFYKL